MKIFISHGHNELAMRRLKDFVQNTLHLEPVILAEQDSRGMAIVEKFEFYAKQCNFALILLTADDKTSDGGLRARQNVVHELGYFYGLLGRSRTLLLKEKGVELFSNIHGIIYEEFPKDQIQNTYEGIRKFLRIGNIIGDDIRSTKESAENLGTGSKKPVQAIQGDINFNESPVENFINIPGGTANIGKL